MTPRNTEIGTDCFARGFLGLRGGGDSGAGVVSDVDMDALPGALFGGLDDKVE